MSTANEWTPRSLLASLAFVGGLTLSAGALFADLIFGTGDSQLGTSQLLGLFAGLALGAIGFALATKRGRVRVLLTLLGASLTLIGLELTLQVGFSARYASLYRADPELLHELIPHAQKDVRLGQGGHNRVAVNSQGLRGPELTSKNDVRRIAVFGDSFIAAEYSPLEETFVARLQKSLNADHGRTVETINAGVVAYGPDQSLLSLKRRFEALQPDAIVFSIFVGNDYGDLVRNQLFALQDGALEPRSPHLNQRLTTDLQRAQSLLILPRAAREFWTRLHDLGSLPQPLGHVEMLTQCRGEVARHRNPENAVVSNLFWDHIDADVRLEPNSTSALYKIELMHAVLAELARWTRERECPLTLVVIPDARDLFREARTHEIDLVQYPHYDAANLVSPVLRSAEELAISVVDLNTLYRSLEDPGHFLPGDHHWSARGQEVAAKAVAEHILTQGSLD